MFNSTYFHRIFHLHRVCSLYHIGIDNYLGYSHTDVDNQLFLEGSQIGTSFVHLHVHFRIYPNEHIAVLQFNCTFSCFTAYLTEIHFYHFLYMPECIIEIFVSHKYWRQVWIMDLNGNFNTITVREYRTAAFSNKS